ncbi:hypothetical protein [Streptomyces sp. H27-S2]|uniref:hypothetical protein n=1 Tax=Streptomyces antarcticus TaxID=2996458 RepID=UPI00226E58A0|nr:hypothetical protein [Streptomyces sp. H27-S2]MCY0950491.1 hypothetical protein [Streptomyces sp. H27-S2]
MKAAIEAHGLGRRFRRRGRALGDGSFRLPGGDGSRCIEPTLEERVPAHLGAPDTPDAPCVPDAADAPDTPDVPARLTPPVEVAV